MLMLPNWGFRNTVHGFHSEKTINLPCKGDSQKNTNSISLSELINTYVPEAKDDYKYWLKPYLFNGSLQNLYLAKADYSKFYPVHFGRQIVEPSEAELNSGEFKHLLPGEFTIDYVVKPIENSKEEFLKRYNETLPEGYPRLHPRTRYYTSTEIENEYKSWSQDDKPIVIIMPGLAGGINEVQIRATCYEFEKKNYNILVINARGCCRSKITTPYLFSGLHTDDLKLIVHRMHAKFPNKSIHLAGFSFGGLMIANYLAIEGENSLVTSALSVSSPFSLNESYYHMTRSLTGKYIFEPAISFYLLNLVKNNLAVLKEDPELHAEERYNALKKNIKKSIEFDDTFTCKLAGFPSAISYYYAASPISRILNIKTPMLFLNSLDDPLISTNYPTLDVEKNPYLYMATCDLGGHYSFINTKGDFWFTNVASEFINAFEENIDNTKKVNDFGYHVEQDNYKDIITLY